MSDVIGYVPVYVLYDIDDETMQKAIVLISIDPDAIRHELDVRVTSAWVEHDLGRALVMPMDLLSVAAIIQEKDKSFTVPFVDVIHVPLSFETIALATGRLDDDLHAGVGRLANPHECTLSHVDSVDRTYGLRKPEQ